MKFSEFINWSSHIKSQFHSIEALLLTYLITFIAVILPIHVVIKDEIHYEKPLYLLLYILTTMYWLWFRFRYPKNNSRQTGLVIAIYAENREEQRIKNLFLREIRRSFNDADLSKVFNIIFIKNHLSKEMNNKNRLAKLHKKVEGHIYFFGDIQKDRDGEHEKYFLVLDGDVKHMPIPLPVSKKLSFDFRNLLPKEINFNSYFGLRGCKVSANVILITCKYVSGVASFLSGNPFLAFKLHNGLEKEIDKFSEMGSRLKEMGSLTRFDIKYLKTLRKDLLLILSNEAVLIARIYHANGDMGNCNKFLAIAQTNNPKNYGLLLLRAVYELTVLSDPQAALDTIRKAEKYSNGTSEWRYSKVFLLFWLAKYELAWKECKKLLKYSYSHENITIAEVEEFSLSLLMKCKDKPQLYFFLAYIQLKKAKNPAMALKYFAEFMSRSDERVDFLRVKAVTYLREIERDMEL